MIDTEREGPNTRLRLIQPILLAAVRRSQEMGKMMVDPIDVLVHLIDDPTIDHDLINAGIDIEKLRAEMAKIDGKTPKRELAEFMLDELKLNHTLYLSHVLQQSIGIAAEVAQSEGTFDVSVQHLLAGLLRQGFNTGLTAFRQAGATEEQLVTLVRTSSRGR